MAHTEHTIFIHPTAPTKVPVGDPCNGCGVCCLFEPCPLGAVLSFSGKGACAALRWDPSRGQYRCGAIVAAQEVALQALPKGFRWIAPLVAPMLRHFALRWIAVGIGCDSVLKVVAVAASPVVAQTTGIDSLTIDQSALKILNKAETPGQ